MNGYLKGFIYVAITMAILYGVDYLLFSLVNKLLGG